ncbi:hypothetical protein, partial [Bacillus altitudinis]|uniref:hypothetical protein n=1 Tax=Bacillus altitudinis TaxID=293387 RepID=UPI0011A8933D
MMRFVVSERIVVLEVFECFEEEEFEEEICECLLEVKEGLACNVHEGEGGRFGLKLVEVWWEV